MICRDERNEIIPLYEPVNQLLSILTESSRPRRRLEYLVRANEDDHITCDVSQACLSVDTRRQIQLESIWTVLFSILNVLGWIYKPVSVHQPFNWLFQRRRVRDGQREGMCT